MWKSSNERRRVVRTAGLVVFIVLLLAGGAYTASAPDQGDSLAPLPVESQSDDATEIKADSQAAVAEAGPPPTIDAVSKALLADARHIEGQANAPVTIVEFSDFQCPFCAGFATDTLYFLTKRYIDTGQVRFAFKHIATLGPASVQAAVASECAADQAAFWAYHHGLYADQVNRHSQLNQKFLVALAEKLGLDQATFEACLASEKHLTTVRDQTLLAQRLGVRGTPGFVVNGRLLIGAQPLEAFAKVIDQELEKAGWLATTATQSTEIDGLTIFPAEPAPSEVLAGRWLNCGIYNQPVALETVLSAMARGAVWIAYRPDLPANQLETLRELVTQARDQLGRPLIILAPDSTAAGPIVATAWRVQLQLDDASDPRLKQFLAEFQAGPFTPDPGQPCSGGIGTPL